MQESVIERCAEAMLELLDDDRVLEYLTLSEQYGLQTVAKQAFAYLELHFWRLANEDHFLFAIRHRSHISRIIRSLVSSQDVLHRLLASANLLVMEGEVDLYYLVKKVSQSQASASVVVDHRASEERVGRRT